MVKSKQYCNLMERKLETSKLKPQIEGNQDRMFCISKIIEPLQEANLDFRQCIPKPMWVL